MKMSSREIKALKRMGYIPVNVTSRDVPFKLYAAVMAIALLLSLALNGYFVLKMLEVGCAVQ